MASAVKYHVNKETGRAGQCRATKKGCPLGEDTPHFNTKEEAKEYIEKNEAANHSQFSTIKKSYSKAEAEAKIRALEETYKKEDQAYREAVDKFYKIRNNLSKEETAKVYDGFKAHGQEMKNLRGTINDLRETVKNGGSENAPKIKSPKGDFKPETVMRRYDGQDPITIKGYSDDVVEIGNMVTEGKGYNQNSWNDEKTILVGDKDGNYVDLNFRYNDKGNWMVESSFSDDELTQRGIKVDRINDPNGSYSGGNHTDSVVLPAHLDRMQVLNGDAADKFYQDNPKQKGSYLVDYAASSKTRTPASSTTTSRADRAAATQAALNSARGATPKSANKTANSDNNPNKLSPAERNRKALATSTNQTDGFHNDLNTARRMAATGPARGALHADYPTLNVKTYNPTRGTGSPEAMDATSFNKAAIILAREDGSKARAIITHDEDPELTAMGKSVTQYKQQHNTNDTKTDGLVVVGSIDSKGNRIGYVPDKNIQTFVFK